MKKTLVISNTGSYGGEQSATLSLAKYLKKLYRIKMFFPEAHHDYYAMRVMRTVVKTAQIARQYRNPNKYLFYTPSVICAGTIIVSTFGLVKVYFHYHGKRVSSLAMTMANSESPLHSLFLDLPANMLILLMQYIALRFSQKVFVPSQETKRQILERNNFLLPQRVIVVPNGVDSTIFCPSARKKIRPTFAVGYVGRPDTEKGLLLLLKAMRRLAIHNQVELNLAFAMYPQETSNIVLTKIRYYRKIFSISVRRNLTPKELAHFYNQQNTCVLFSYREQFPLVILEAASCGVPTLLSPIREHIAIARQISIDILVPEMSVSSLVASLISMREKSPSQRKDLETKLIRWASKFSWENAASTIATHLE